MMVKINRFLLQIISRRSFRPLSPQAMGEYILNGKAFPVLVISALALIGCNCPAKKSSGNVLIVPSIAQPQQICSRLHLAPGHGFDSAVVKMIRYYDRCNHVISLGFYRF